MPPPKATKLIFNKDEAWEKYLTHCGDSITILETFVDRVSFSLAKKTEDVDPTVRYLGRYFKRLLIAVSRLHHYELPLFAFTS